MSLIKKTIVLVKEKAKGYITLIKLGESAGAKLVFSEPTDKRFWLALKVGENPQFMAPFSGSRAEFDFSMDFDANDLIGVTVTDEKGYVYAFGGRKELVNMKLLKTAVEESERKTFAEKEPEREPEMPPRDRTEVPHTEHIVTASAAAKDEPVISEPQPQPEPEMEIEAELRAKMAAESKRKAEAAEEMRKKAEAELKKKAEEDIRRQAEAEAEEIRKRAEEEAERIRREAQAEAEEIKKRAVEKPEIEIQNPELDKKNPFNIPKGDNFYQSIRMRLDDIMSINPREERLEKLIPDSKWVKVKYDGEDYYVVGVLTDEGVTTHIAYGVPGRQSVRPPKEAEQLCDFLPFSATSSEGYWLMFQDAKNGEMVRN